MNEVHKVLGFFPTVRVEVVLIGNDGQLMPGGPPVLWLSTNAVQLIVPIDDDGQLMSGGPPVLGLSADAVRLTVPLKMQYD